VKARRASLRMLPLAPSVSASLATVSSSGTSTMASAVCSQQLRGHIPEPRLACHVLLLAGSDVGAAWDQLGFESLVPVDAHDFHVHSREHVRRYRLLPSGGLTISRLYF
jgi:hypothetical protein